MTVYNVLFLCTANSARSIMAEAILNKEGAGRFRGFSAGAKPRGSVHPNAIGTLERLGHDTGFARSKGWDELAAPDAPHMDFVFTVCDQAAAEACPIWPGHPATAHWGIPDPAAAQGNEAERALAFADAYRLLLNRISLLLALPIESLDKLALEQRIREIGSAEADADA